MRSFTDTSWKLRNGKIDTKKPCGFVHLRQHVSKPVATIRRSNGGSAHTLPTDIIKLHTPETHKNKLWRQNNILFIAYNASYYIRRRKKVHYLRWKQRRLRNNMTNGDASTPQHIVMFNIRTLIDYYYCYSRMSMRMWPLEGRIQSVKKNMKRVYYIHATMYRVPRPASSWVWLKTLKHKLYFSQFFIKIKWQ